MPINDNVSKHIKLIEKKTEIFQMDPFYEINSQFAHYLLLDSHTLYAAIADKLALVKSK